MRAARCSACRAYFCGGRGSWFSADVLVQALVRVQLRVTRPTSCSCTRPTSCLGTRSCSYSGPRSLTFVLKQVWVRIGNHSQFFFSFAKLERIATLASGMNRISRKRTERISKKTSNLESRTQPLSHLMETCHNIFAELLLKCERIEYFDLLVDQNPQPSGESLYSSTYSMRAKDQRIQKYRND